MTINSYTWLYRSLELRLYTGIHGYTQTYMAIHRDKWLYTVIHAYTQLSEATHRHTWLYTDIHGYTQAQMAIHSYTWLYIALHIFVRDCTQYGIHFLATSRQYNVELPSKNRN